jgi:hypothetical protein
MCVNDDRNSIREMKRSRDTYKRFEELCVWV